MSKRNFYFETEGVYVTTNTLEAAWTELGLLLELLQKPIFKWKIYKKMNTGYVSYCSSDSHRSHVISGSLFNWDLHVGTSIRAVDIIQPRIWTNMHTHTHTHIYMYI